MEDREKLKKKAEKKGRPFSDRWVASSFNKQENLLMRLVFVGKMNSRFLYLYAKS